jgi:Uma2 family endonuclease
MASMRRTATKRPVEYPTSDGKPMAETDVHRQDMVDLIAMLQDHFAADPFVYISGNILLFYEEGNRRKHVATDVLMVRGVPKLPPRKYYLLWEEGRGPDVVIELTSKTTRREDRNKKLGLYRDVLRVTEYYLFDPFEEYLKPSMQGYRLIDGQYVAIAWEGGRLPSDLLGLHLERDGSVLRLYDPATRRRLLTPQERVAEAAQARQRAEEGRQRAEEERQRAEEERQREAEGRRQLEAEVERLRRELEVLQQKRSSDT